MSGYKIIDGPHAAARHECPWILAEREKGPTSWQIKREPGCVSLTGKLLQKVTRGHGELCEIKAEPGHSGAKHLMSDTYTVICASSGLGTRL